MCNQNHQVEIPNTGWHIACHRTRKLKLTGAGSDISLEIEKFSFQQEQTQVCLQELYSGGQK